MAVTEWVVTPGVWVVEGGWFRSELVIGSVDQKAVAIITLPRTSAVSDAVLAVPEPLLSPIRPSPPHLMPHLDMEWVHRLWQALPVLVLSLLLLQAGMAPEHSVVNSMVVHQAHTLFQQDSVPPQERTRL